jgi:hypothetical protein
LIQPEHDLQHDDKPKQQHKERGEGGGKLRETREWGREESEKRETRQASCNAVYVIKHQVTKPITIDYRNVCTHTNKPNVCCEFSLYHYGIFLSIWIFGPSRMVGQHLSSCPAT